VRVAARKSSRYNRNSQPAAHTRAKKPRDEHKHRQAAWQRRRITSMVEQPRRTDRVTTRVPMHAGTFATKPREIWQHEARPSGLQAVHGESIHQKAAARRLARVFDSGRTIK